jgi:DNA polymerase/3'-5' exonuclease PolX
MLLREAKEIADQFLLAHGHWFDRAEIAGSIRRGKPEVKDIEVVAIPSRGELKKWTDLFGTTVHEEYSGGFEALFEAALRPETCWEWELDPEAPLNGKKYKRLRHKASGICMDLFLTDPAGWGICYTIRTGPGEFSQTLVTHALKLRKHVTKNRLHDHPKAGDKNPCPMAEGCPLIIPTPEEYDFFHALGLPWIEPSERDLELIWAKERAKHE